MGLLETPLYAYSQLRSAGFAAQYFMLNLASGLAPGLRDTDSHPISKDAIAEIQQEMSKLFRLDAHNIAEGLYPVSVLRPEPAMEHLRRLPKLIADGYSIYRRRARGRTARFTPQAEALAQELPRYYRRNFHFQTNGYLSEESAELYEHQVEMLFGGAADAMRRLILPPLKTAFSGSDGAGLTFLEVGAGTGKVSRFVRAAFPKAKIVITDLSGPYLKVARRKLGDLDRLDFVQAPGENLPFRDAQFDAVYSVFLFHELPLEVRRAVLVESRRVLKPQGFLGLVDALQTGDKPPFDNLLANFPKDFHEPFFRSYLEHPMEALLKDLGSGRVQSNTGFLSKVLWVS